MGNQHGIYLATKHSGRLYVMGFRRMGLQGAQPVFRGERQMLPAADLVMFEVGDRKARGFTEGKADNSVYRYDITGIDNADAHLIAAAPDLYKALDRLATNWSAFSYEEQGLALAAATSALAKARGETA